MEINDFIQNFASQFEETEANKFTATTEFRSLEEWSSLLALSIIAMVDDVYNVRIKGDDIKNSKTIEDLYNIVKLKK
ncbi:MAG: acyl carrier protein [Bacteroidales bacterium]|nr:acyl carrier protein [Bacteroidales bacterium]